MSRRLALVLCCFLVVAAGCTSTRSREGMAPEDVFDTDLPPPEKPPIEIRSRIERDPTTGTYSYVYTVSNGTPYPITDFHIGLSGRNGDNAIRRPPLELTKDGRMPPAGYSAPLGWSLLYERDARSLGSLTWTAYDPVVWIAPGEVLTGFRVSVSRKDEEYERSHWTTLQNSGVAGTYTGALEREPTPAGDPVDRLGRLSISPRASRGDVTVRYRTPKSARPLVFILDSKGEVIRAFPQGPRSGGERELVWDRRDAERRTVPPGEYFIEVRYGYTERFGRVTLLR